MLRDCHRAILMALVAFLVYNANLRVIGAGDSLPARFIPFALWGDGTVYLDPVLDSTTQGHSSPYWIRSTVVGHKASLYPLVTPLMVSPLYLPAVGYLHLRGWTEERMNKIALLMEKVSASLVASLAAGWMFLLLRRRLEARDALLLSALFAFGTSTWSISSQALWQHGPAELLIVAALWLLTSEPTTGRAVAAGLVVGLIVANRPPDAPLALAFAAWVPFWGRLRAVPFALAAAVPVALILAYNLHTFANPAGGYGHAGVASASFFTNPPLEGVAGLLVSPGRGLLVFTPFLLFLPLLYLRTLRDRPHHLLTLFLTGGVLLQILLYAPSDWRAGFSYGPRFLTDALPILVWMIAPVLASLERKGRIAFLAAGLFSIYVQVVGAFLYIGTSDLILYRVKTGPGCMMAAWEPRNAPFLLEMENGLASRSLWWVIYGSLAD